MSEVRRRHQRGCAHRGAINASQGRSRPAKREARWMAEREEAWKTEARGLAAERERSAMSDEMTRAKYARMNSEIERAAERMLASELAAPSGSAVPVSDEEKAKLRALIKPVILEMHKRKWNTVTISLDGTIGTITARQNAPAHRPAHTTEDSHHAKDQT